MTLSRAVSRVTALGALAFAASCGGGERPNPLLADPMADVSVPGATRVERTITNPSDSSFLGKPRQAEVVQVFRVAGGAGKTKARVIAALVQQATVSGWVFDTSMRGMDLGELAQKDLSGDPAMLTVGPGNEDPTSVYLILTAD